MARITVREDNGIVTVTLETMDEGRPVFQQFVVPKQLFADLMMVLLDEGYLT
jgi:hypothetical protein